jgi:peroxiredoxin Q/BCP
MATLNTGDAAPDFVATTHTGTTLRLSDLHGHRVAIWFYPKADTPG